MAFLKAVKDSFCFIYRGARFQILGPKYEMVSVPLNTDFIWVYWAGIDNVELNLRENIC